MADAAEGVLAAGLASPDPWVRYWVLCRTQHLASMVQRQTPPNTTANLFSGKSSLESENTELHGSIVKYNEVQVCSYVGILPQDTPHLPVS